MKISITLPSIYPEALNRTLANIQAATRGEYEVVVVSPFRVEGPHVVWVEETERRGCAFAHNVAARRATGDLIAAFADDWTFVDGWDEKILPDFIERESRWKDGYLMGLRYDYCDLVGTVYGIYYANFPLMRRAGLERFGWVGDDYKVSFGDCDLSLRVWSQGGRCEFSAQKVLNITKDDAGRKAAVFVPQDLALFHSRWAPLYGKGWGSELRDFNLDVIPEELEGAMEQRTIYRNTPEFLVALAKNAEASSRPPFLIESSDAINIVEFRGRFYCVPKALGPIDLNKSEDRQRPGMLSYDSLAGARTAMAAMPAVPGAAVASDGNKKGLSFKALKRRLLGWLSPQKD